MDIWSPCLVRCLDLVPVNATWGWGLVLHSNFSTWSSTLCFAPSAMGWVGLHLNFCTLGWIAWRFSRGWIAWCFDIFMLCWISWCFDIFALGWIASCFSSSTLGYVVTHFRSDLCYALVLSIRRRAWRFQFRTLVLVRPKFGSFLASSIAVSLMMGRDGFCSKVF